MSNSKQRRSPKVLLISIAMTIAMLVTLIPASVITRAAEPEYTETYTLEYADIFDLSTEYPGYKVASCNVIDSKDAAVIAPYGENGIRAVGTGEGYVELKKVKNTIYLKFTVKPAKLSLLFISGQSNAEGSCSYGNYYYDQTIANEPGSVFSTYVPSEPAEYESITGVEAKELCTPDNSDKFVPKDLVSDKNLDGEDLQYSLETLNEGHHGKTGMDSAIAYKWHTMTDEKVWVVNASWWGSFINEWDPEDYYFRRAIGIFSGCLDTYEKEIKAGHIIAGKKAMFWLQGESDKTTSLSDYKKSFLKTFNAFDDALGLDALGIVAVRSCINTCIDEDDIYMNDTRIAQYAMALSATEPKIFMVSNVNEKWVTDAGVKEYFSEAYPSGKLDYPMMHDWANRALPVRIEDVHGDVHYSQVGHNENGLTAALSMYEYLYGKSADKAVECSFRDELGRPVSDKLVGVGKDAVVVPVTDPLTSSKTVKFKVSNSNISFDPATCRVKGIDIGSAYLSAYDLKDNLIGQMTINVVEKDPKDFTDEVGNNYNGLYDNNGQLINLNRGLLDDTYWGFAEYGEDTWYVCAGQVTYDRNGLFRDKRRDHEAWRWVENSLFTKIDSVEQNEVGWWRVKDGIVDFDATGVYQNRYGWWYCDNGFVDFTYNGIGSNEYGDWAIVNGGVDFSVNGLREAGDGWYIFYRGQVNHSANGLFENEYGWWYVKDGQVDFTYDGIVQNEWGWWCVKEGQVRFDYTGMASNQWGDWRIVDGKVDFEAWGLYEADGNWYLFRDGKVDHSANGLFENEYGWWYVKDGQVDFSFSGLVKNDYGTWYVRDGGVDFDENGTVYSGGKFYKLVNGKVDYSYTAGLSNIFS